MPMDHTPSLFSTVSDITSYFKGGLQFHTCVCTVPANLLIIVVSRMVAA